MQIPNLLCIETSSALCSVALGKGNVLADEYIADEPNGHSALLAVMLDEITRRNNISLDDLDAIAVNSGPGSYTGLRIGMSTAKGLCYATGKPLMAIPAFDGMVRAFLKDFRPEKNHILQPMIDARRMEVYTQSFDGDGNPLGPQMAYISGEAGLFSVEPRSKVWLFGSGAEKMAAGLSRYSVEVVSGTFLSASGLLETAYERWQSRQFDDVAYVTPNYGKAWQKM